MKIFSTFFFLVALIIAAAVTTTTFFVSSQSTTKIIHLSDFHQDPFFATKCAENGACKAADTKLTGNPGCDSSLTMIRGALRSAARHIVDLNIDTAIIIYTGDWFRHGMNDACVGNSNEVGMQIIESTLEAFEKDLLQYAQDYQMEKVKERYLDKGILVKVRVPEIHFVPSGHHAISSSSSSSRTKNKRYQHQPLASVVDIEKPVGSTGNDDYIPDYFFNYSSQPNVILQKFGTSLLKRGFLNTFPQADAFAKCGYSWREIVNSKIRVIVLNTLLWSTQIKPAVSPSDADPCSQFAFLKQQLDAARTNNQKVFIQSHIPPLFGLWSPFRTFFHAYASLMEEYNDIISIQLYGHIHRFQYGVLTGPKSGTQNIAPMFLGGPITRASKTIPDFGIYDLDPVNFTVTDIHQVSILENATDPLNASSWSYGPSFKESMGLSDLSSPSLYQLATNFRRNSNFDGTFQKYFAFEQGGRIPNGVNCTGSCQNLAACELISFTTGEDLKCNW